MGLFSFSNKNKQETTAEDSGYCEPTPRRRKGAKAGADDPILPEKKRARRRLVGAIALALAVAVGLPMLLDSEPKQLASDIAIQIPSRDKASPLPLPTAPGAAPAPAESLDQSEKLVDPKPDPADIKTVHLDSAAHAAPKAEAQPELKQPAKAEAKPVDTRLTETRHAETKVAEPKAAEPKPAEPKPVQKPAPKAEEKPAAKPVQEDTRALAILEGKTADKAAKAETAGQKFVVQVAALATQEKVTELQDKLREAGIKSFTHKVPTATGERIQVRVGPFSREEADKMRARLDKVGLSGSMVRSDGK
jgi:DedD protein